MRKVGFDRASATAGLELAAMSMPQSLGYAAIAGMPAVTGLYTLLLPIAGFAVFGSSPYLVVAADSATAAILAGGLAPLAAPESARYIELAGLAALLTALFLLIARGLKLGFISDFLSQTVLAGFLTGVGFQVAIAVLPQMLGVAVTSRRTVVQVGEMFAQWGRIDGRDLALAALIVAAVLLLGRFAPRVPAPLLAVVGSIAASWAWDFAKHGIAVIGPVTGGFPHPTLPSVHWKDVDTLMPIAASCFVMIVTQSAATARVYAQKHRESLDENADLLGLSVANGLAAFSGAFVVNGSPTQTAVLESTGGKGRVAHFTTAVVVAMVLLLFTGPLQYLPKCVLGAIVFTVAVRLIHFKNLREIRRESPGEYALAALTAGVVVLAGVEQGIILAMTMSVLRIVSHSYRPHTAVLVKGQDEIWHMEPVKPGAITEPGLAIYRFGAPLFYANAGRFADQIRTLVGPEPSKLRWVLVDAGAITKLDYSAARVVADLLAELKLRGVALVFAHVESGLQADLDRHHLTDAIGRDRIFDKLHEAIASYRELPRR